MFLIGFFCWFQGAILSQDQLDSSIPQNIKITGQVTDESEKPIQGAKASLKFDFNENLTFELRPTGKIRGKVVCNETDIPNPDLTGRKVSVASYEKPSADKNNRLNRFAQDFFNRVQCHQQIELDYYGCFELDGVLSGDVSVRLDMGDSELQPIPKQHETLEADDELEMEIEVAKAVPVYGTLLTDDTREPLASVRISIYRAGNAPQNRLATTSDANGKFKVYLHPGEYTV